jgi:hypothetical protein
VVIDARDNKVFAKGLPSAHRRVITQARKAAIAPLVRDISLALLWHFDETGWNVLGYEYAPGRHADYSPASPDLAGCLRWTGTDPLGLDAGQRAGIGTPHLADRLGLAHPRRRLDRPGLMGAAPHGVRRPHADEAERQASRLQASRAADPAHIDLFAAANVRLWDEIAQLNTSAWTTKMARAAKSWDACRQAR